MFSNTEVMVAIVTGFFGLMTAILVPLLTGKDKEKKKAKVKLTSHNVFSRLDTLQGHVERTFTLKNKGKEIVFKDIIANQLSVFRDNLYELAESIDNNDKIEKTELCNAYMETYKKILNSIHSYYLSDDRYSADEKLVLNIVMKKYERWNQEKVDFILEGMLSASSSSFYDTPQIRTSVVLDMYLAVAIDTINYAEKTLNNINGDLRGLVFKGVEI